MRRITCCAFVATLVLTFTCAERTGAEVIDPSDAHGIRQLPGQNPFLLDFLSINHSVEDRTVIEFALRRLAGPVGSATLNLDLRNLDPGLPGVIEVFTFAGTGTVTPDLLGGDLVYQFRQQHQRSGARGRVRRGVGSPASGRRFHRFPPFHDDRLAVSVRAAFHSSRPFAHCRGRTRAWHTGAPRHRRNRLRLAASAK